VGIGPLRLISRFQSNYKATEYKIQWQNGKNTAEISKSGLSNLEEIFRE
jgi:hypothetical protein